MSQPQIQLTVMPQEQWKRNKKTIGNWLKEVAICKCQCKKGFRCGVEEQEFGVKAVNEMLC